ncbi:hypothetical protein, partial [Campylobacter coli]|uniref:hypothetical protein n=1 Tax=Campylobacter coli TaxID=195 RepID=UPI001892CDCB
FFFFKQKTAYEMLRSLVGSEMCIRDSPYLSTITVEIIQKIYLYGLQDRYQAIVASFVTDYLKELTSKTIQLQESKQLITNQTTQIQNLNNTLNKT